MEPRLVARVGVGAAGDTGPNWLVIGLGAAGVWLAYNVWQGYNAPAARPRSVTVRTRPAGYNYGTGKVRKQSNWAVSFDRRPGGPRDRVDGFSSFSDAVDWSHEKLSPRRRPKVFKVS